MSLALRFRFQTRFHFPRVSGDEPAYADTAATTVGFSPRERG